jgi:hypothetical protein
VEWLRRFIAEGEAALTSRIESIPWEGVG